MRLAGPELALGDALSIPSEPIVRGSVQVSGDGVPTVLLADHQTMGGYPKIATVVDGDLDRLAQCRSGDRVRFQVVEPQAAVAYAREQRALRAAALEEIRAPRASLEERLLSRNLIDGVVGDWG